MTARSTVIRLLGAAAVSGLCAIGAYVAAQPAERVIVIHTKKFNFTPDHLTLKKGEPVVFDFVADDVVMGFNLTDFGVRTDIIPGKTTRMRFGCAGRSSPVPAG